MLQLTAGQQNVLAELCLLARKGVEDIVEDKPILDSNVVKDFTEIVIRAYANGFPPASFDRMYDLLHRTGANE